MFRNPKDHRILVFLWSNKQIVGPSDLTNHNSKALLTTISAASNLNLINNVRNVIVLGLKVFKSSNLYIFSCCRIAHGTFVQNHKSEIISLKIVKIDISFLLDHTWESLLGVTIHDSRKAKSLNKKRAKFYPTRANQQHSIHILEHYILIQWVSENSEIWRRHLDSCCDLK